MSVLSPEWSGSRPNSAAIIRQPEMAQNRRSRVSFAPDDHRRLSRLSMPARRDSNLRDLILSPDQEVGPRVLDDRSLGHLARPSLGGRSTSNLRNELGTSPDTAAAVTLSAAFTEKDAEEVRPPPSLFVPN